MSERKKHDVCPLEHAKALNSVFRRILQNPKSILKPYVKESFCALDVGCGPGVFSEALAKLVGEKGEIVALDLQEGMLDYTKDLLKKKGLLDRVSFHKCDKDSLGVTGEFDFILAFYVVHELPDERAFFKEAYSLLKEGGSLLFVEPKMHVKEEDFLKSLESAYSEGFKLKTRPKIFFSKSALLTR